MEMIETERLLLREWRPEDLPNYAALNRDPRVMQYLLHTLNEEAAAAKIKDIQNHFREHGFGLFACILKESNTCIGSVGLNVLDFVTPIYPIRINLRNTNFSTIC